MEPDENQDLEQEGQGQYEEEPEETPEYDAQGNDLSSQPEPEIEQQQPEAPEPEVPSVPAYVPQEGEDADDALLRQVLGDDAYAALMRRQDKKLAVQMQTHSIGAVHVAARAAQSPDYFAKYGAQVQHALSRMAPADRAKPEAVDGAIMFTIYEEATRTGDLKATMRRHLNFLEGNGAQAQPKQPQRAPIPPSQRTPQPTAAPRPRPSSPQSATDRRVRSLVEQYGVTEGEAKAMLNEEKVFG